MSEKTVDFSKFGKVQPETSKVPFSYGSKLNVDDFSSNNKSQVMHYRLIPVGTYDFTVVDVHFGESKTSGNDMVTITLSIPAEETEDGEEVWISDNFVMKETMKWKMAQFFSCVGLIDVAIEKGIGAAFEAASGKTGKVTTRHDTYGGTERNKVAKYVTGK